MKKGQEKKKNEQLFYTETKEKCSCGAYKYKIHNLNKCSIEYQGLICNQCNKGRKFFYISNKVVKVIE